MDEQRVNPEPSLLNSDQLRKIRRILASMIGMTGCIVLVVECGRVDTIYQVKNFKIEPTEQVG